jgi:hypothetical protein
LGGQSTRETFESHLQLRQAGDFESDLRLNYAEDVVVLAGSGMYHGHDGVRETRKLLVSRLPDSQYHYLTQRSSGDVAFLEWSADSPIAKVRDGADSFLVRDGLIRVQTIHYTVVPN